MQPINNVHANGVADDRNTATRLDSRASCDVARSMEKALGSIHVRDVDRRKANVRGSSLVNHVAAHSESKNGSVATANDSGYCVAEAYDEYFVGVASPCRRLASACADAW